MNCAAVIVVGSPVAYKRVGHCRWGWPDYAHAGVGRWRQSRGWPQSVVTHIVTAYFSFPC